MDATQDEVAPQVNGDKDEKATADASDIAVVEENAAEKKSEDVSEVGFKKIFRFVGFKFTLKKDKVEEKDPVELLTVKDKEEESKSEEPTKEAEEAHVEESTSEAKEVKATQSNAEVIEDGKEAETANEAEVKEDDPEKGPDATMSSPETVVSPFRKLFNTGLFSNLKKKASIKKTKEEEEKKEVSPEGETKKTEDASADAKAEGLKSGTEQEPETETSVQEKAEPKEEAKAGPSEEPQATQEDKIHPAAEEESGTAEVISEAELLSSQEKTKVQGSPLKKLFTGAGLKKLSVKKQRTKKDAETKAESGEDVAEQLQSSTESAEAPKIDSGPSSPEESGEHADVQRLESTQESQGEVADGEKKREGIIAWSSFKKLVTPKRHVKRSSESDEEAPEEKPAKTATLSSSQSTPIADRFAEEETKEDQPNEETENADKLESTEEPKKKMDTSVSWDALMCMGGQKKRTRKTSDSDEEETKIEEQLQPAAEGEQIAEAASVTPQTLDPDGQLRSPEEHANRESAWDTLKRVVMPKPKAKVEEKNGESSEQVQSDSEAQKDEQSFSFKKFLPGRRKKKADKQVSEQSSNGDDSDTPAVVPMSEYEEQVERKEEAESDGAQANVSHDDRSPSWIPAAVDDPDQHNELSDIAEEAETAATPKSADTDTADEEIKDEPIESPDSSQSMGRRLSRAEVKPVAPAPTGETTPVPQGPKPDQADEVREGIEVLVSEVSTQMSVAVNDVPIEQASETIEYEPPFDKAECITTPLLEPHAREEAMAICTGLGTKEIAKVALEEPAIPVIESVTVVGEGLSTEVAVDNKPHTSTDAIITEDPLLRAQVHQVDTTSLGPAVEIPTDDASVIQTASEDYEPEVENIGVVTTIVEAEILQPINMCENSPKTVLINSITPTTEELVCSSITEITEHTIEIKEVEVPVQQQKATLAYAPLNAAAEAVCKAKIHTNISVTKEGEVATPVSVPSEEGPMVTRTKVLVGPRLDIGVGQVEISDVEVVHSEAVKVQQESDIEAQSIVITQAVIQDAVDKVAKDTEEPKKPSTPTPVQAETSTEKEVEVSTETPVITDTPKVLSCEKSPKPLCVALEIIDSVPVEVANSLKPSEEEEEEPRKGVKQAVEIKVSGETVILDMKEKERQSDEDQEQIKKKESKEESEVQEPGIEGVVEEVETASETEKPTSEAPLEEKTPEAIEIHMPVQVVLQSAQVTEDPSVEEEAAEEFDSNSPVVKDSSPDLQKAEPSSLSNLVEEPQGLPSEDSEPSQVTQAAAGQPEKETQSSGNCAQVMAQVIEVIEEAVKEIEPAMEDSSAAS